MGGVLRPGKRGSSRDKLYLTEGVDNGDWILLSVLSCTRYLQPGILNEKSVAEHCFQESKKEKKPYPLHGSFLCNKEGLGAF